MFSSRRDVVVFGWTEDGRRVISISRTQAIRRGPPLSPSWLVFQFSLLAASGFALGYAVQVLGPR